MSSWTVPLSSSPQIPSTPQSGQRPRGFFANSPNGSAKRSLAPNPSTTPAGLPPSSVGSFTPAEPPPSSMLDSSQLGSGKLLFNSGGSSGANKGLLRNVKPPFSNATNQLNLPRYLDENRNLDIESSRPKSTKYKFGMPSSSPPQSLSGDEDGDYEDEDGSEHLEEEADAFASEDQDNMAVDSGNMSDLLNLDSPVSSIPKKSLANGDFHGFGSSILDATPRGTKRSRGGSRCFGVSQSSRKRPAKPKYESAIPSIANNMATQLSVANLEERDEFIVGTEDILQQDLYGTEILGEQHEQALKAGLPRVSERLSNFWRSLCAQDLARLAPKQDFYKGIGPDENAPTVHKATFLAALLLQLRHPPTAKGKQALAIAPLHRSSRRSKPPETDNTPSNSTAFPKILIEWLNNSHDPYAPFNIDVLRFQPNPTAHFNYWDLLFSMTLRGKLADVIHLLRRSNFHHAKTAKDDRKDGEGYSSVQVRNIERVINRAAQVLENCPSIRDDDWNVTGNEWILFRKRVEQAINDLATFAEGRGRETDSAESTLEASSFGLRSTTMGLSQSARKAESQVPWTIYQNLKTMYGILLGETTEILAMAQDWVEATIGLTVWWVGDDDEDIAVGSVALTRRSLRKSTSHGTRLVDVNPNAAYLRRLAFAIECVDAESSDEKGLAINTLSPVEVGLASVFEGNVEGVMGLLRAWSLPVFSAVAEIASAGGWLNTQAGVSVMHGLDESDLILLNGRKLPTKQMMTRDASLILYADALSYRGHILGSDREALQEGWEISICILTRLNDENLAAEKVRNLLQRLPTDSDERVDTILDTCKRFGITKEAREIAEKYADHVAETSDNYGTALIYYARAHRQKKVKDVLDLLISLSLVQSSAYPALADLDRNLKALIVEKRSSLGQVALEDPKAAEILHTYMTGYATLRRFYDLRDEEVQLQEGQKPRLRPIARKNAAAIALVALINSAADNIHGGLYDEDRGAVVQVDALLTLLGEAMVFVNQSGFLLSLPQCFALLKAIEDLKTVSPRIYSHGEECFRSTLAACQGRATPSSPRGLLKKTMSSMTSSFSVVGDSMVNSESSGIGSSKALVKSQEEVQRGWDWRKGLGEKAKAEDVLRILRLGLAKDIAKHWMAGEGS